MKPRLFSLLSIFIALGLLLAACQPAAVTENPPAVTTPSPTSAPTAAITPSKTPAASPSSTAPASVPGGQTPAAAATAAGTTKPRVVGYYSSGSAAHGYQIADIPADQLDAVIYAFLGLTPSGDCFPLSATQDSANFIALRQLKLAHPKLSILFSVGGASNSTLFSDVAATAALREHFAQSCVAFMKKNGFSGIDIDWEYPVSGGAAGVHHNPADKQNLTALLAALRKQLDEQGSADQTHYLLSLAGPAGAEQIANLELNAIPASLDWIDLMAYDFVTQASATTGFKAPLFASTADPSAKKQANTIDAAVKAYLAAGVPASKLILGAGLYGRGWKGVAATNNGLFQANSGPAQGTWAKDGVFGYQDLAANYLPAYTRSYDSGAQAVWLYSSAAQVFITYEDAQSLSAKAAYVNNNHLGGMMVWELSFDDPQHTLLKAVEAGVRQPK
jgi:chitinase